MFMILSMYWTSTILLLSLTSSAGSLESSFCQSSETELLLWCSNGYQCYTESQHCDGHSDCQDTSDENCTDVEIKQHIHERGGLHRKENLAWLVTPIIVCVAVVYLIYKCAKDSICHFRRFRRHASEQPSRFDNNYTRLQQLSSHIPATRIGIPACRTSSHQHLMVVHNSSFAISLGSEPGCLTNCGFEISNSVPIPSPPSYEEAMAATALTPTLSSQPEDPELPTYSDVITDSSNTAVFTIGDPEDADNDEDKMHMDQPNNP